MKISPAISIGLWAMCCIFAVVAVALGISNRELKVRMQEQEQALQVADAELGKQQQVLRSLDEKAKSQTAALLEQKEKQTAQQLVVQEQLVQLNKQRKAKQDQEKEISEGKVITEKLGPMLIQDLATLSTTNEKMKLLLLKHGYKVEVKE